jgi:Serpin (serine protease inhibitor)
MANTCEKGLSLTAGILERPCRAETAPILYTSGIQINLQVPYEIAGQTQVTLQYALLPQPGRTPKDVLDSLDADQLGGGAAGFDLDLKLPRFSLDFSASLVDYLKRMGMDVAFHYPAADFGPMGSRDFFISNVIHKTRLEVDEKGTVAAAATAVAMASGSAMRQPRPVKILVFDRPFVALIGDSQTRALLFAGVIEDP